ncbi:MAG: response regulator [Halobacterium sp.]
MAGHTGTPTVLVVDDEEEIVDLVETFVPEYCRTKTATSASEALDEYGEDVDVVFLDRRLPDASGDRVLEQLRDHEADCRVAMVSAVAEQHNQDAVDYDAYVSKPFSSSDIVETTTELLPSEYT